MPTNYVVKMNKSGGGTFDVKDKEAREMISSINSQLNNLSIDYNDCTFIETGNNIFNRSSEEIIADKYINVSGIAPLAGYYVSEPMKLKANTQYKWDAPSGFGNSSYIAVTDKNGNVLSTEEVTKSNGYILYTPTSEKYIRINLGNVTNIRTTTIMVCESAHFPQSFEPYKCYADGLGLSDEMEAEVRQITGNSKLYGKTLAVTGDSICYGQGASGGYGAIIAARNNMTFQNVGVSGGTIKAETYSGSTARFWICRSIEDMRSDADYILLEGGVNDGLGDIGSLSSGYDAELDDTTLYGAFESMFKAAINRFPGKKIGYIFAHKCTNSYSSNGDSNNPYYVAMTCCKKWGIPFVDLNTIVPPIGFIDDLKEAYTANGDGWHPNADGYNAFYVPQIEAFMNSL